jgi:nicotinate-nucleotide pyrophosphorylase (carboxylating)
MLSEQLRVEIQRNIAASLAEDIGTGDLTARLIAPDTEARGRVITREDAVICGTRVVRRRLRRAQPLRR